LVDTSTDLRQQFISNNIHKIDAVFWTHDHADHAHGIDDLRPLRYGRSGPIPGYGVDETVRRLRQRFGYVFAGQFGYHTIVQLETLSQLRMCAGIGIGWTVMPHGPAKSTGFRFDCDGQTISYATDFSEITDEMVSLFYGSACFDHRLFAPRSASNACQSGHVTGIGCKDQGKEGRLDPSRQKYGLRDVKSGSSVEC
jgi:phosphoribosyl 1,2-cyclic phosphate phosphodiesterase